jgi:tRNA threonylcarbamoyl adenosine modification protein (Sua5/YciO/YrdC/YwlC family)
MTRVLQVPSSGFDPASLEEAAGILRSGGIVAIPTETVYGLAASSRIPEAVERLMKIKGRPVGKPFSYHLSSVDHIADLVEEVPPLARRLLERYAPGPITLVLPGKKDAGGGWVGVRVPGNEIARKVIELAGAPLFVPSANRAGEPPAVRADEVLKLFDGEIDTIVDGGPSLLKEASAVVRVDTSGYEVLREGIVTKEMIHQLLEGRRILFVCTGNTCRSPMAAEIFRKRLAEKLGKPPDELNELGYRILSAGTFAVRGSPASEHAVELLREMGCDLSRHSSRPLEPALLAEVDRVYALSHSHLQILQRMAANLEPAARPRIDQLSEESITDPVGGDMETYRQCAREIDDAIRRVLGG